MAKKNGFSLTEVLISLLLLTTTLLGLLKQQWHISQLFNQTHARLISVLQQDNALERCSEAKPQ